MHRLLSVITVVVLVFGITSCGGGGSTSSTSTPPPTTTTTSGSTNPVPQIVDLQDAGVSGSSLILRVIGTGFVTSSSVRWNGTTMATTFVSSTQLTFTITVADVPPSGTVPMNVVNPPPGGGTSNTVTIQFTTVQPVLTSISPPEAVQGDPGLTLQVNGNSFFQSSVVKWNGVTLPTTYISGSQLSAQVSATLLAQSGTANVVVFTDGPANGATSNYLPFTIRQHYATLGSTIALRANALKFDASKNRLYASAPSSAGATYGNSIVEIDTSSVPAISSSAFVGSEPGKLALSDDGSTLFVELRGAAALRKYDTNAHSPDLQFTLGPDPLYGTYYVGDMEVVPGSNTALAVSRMTPNISPGFAGVAVYDDGVKRPNETPRYFAASADRIEFGTSPSLLFGFDGNTLSTIQVDGNGATNIDSTPNLFPGSDIKWDAGRLYSTSGWVVDPINKTVLGGFNLAGMQVFQVLPDTANNRVYFIGQTGVGKVIASYNATTFAPLDSVGLPAFDGEFAAAAYLGSGKFAIASDHGTIFFVNVTPAPATAILPSLTGIAPNWAVQGSSPLTLQVTGNSFLAGSVVKWNGSPLSTTFVSSTRLDAQIGATELSKAGTAQVTVFNPGPGNGATSIAASFTVVEHNATVTNTVTLRADALQFNSASNRLYASVPGSAGPTYGNSVVEIDTTGVPAIATSSFVGSEPGTMALSQDGSTLYVALRGAAAVRKYDIATHSPGLQFSLGSEQDFGLFYVDDMQVVPGTTNALAVSRKVFTGNSGHAGVAIYEDGIPRANTTGPTPGHSGANRIEFGAAGDTIFGMSTESAGYFKIQIDSNGAQVVDSDHSLLAGGQDVKWDAGRLYNDYGQIADPSTKSRVGTFILPNIFVNAVVPDVAHQRVYFIGRNDANKWIVAFDPSNFTLADTLSIPGFVGEVTAVAYLGSGSFAIASDSGTIFFVSAVPMQSATVQPSIAQLIPNQLLQGSSGFSLHVMGNGFLPNSIVKWNGSALPTSYEKTTRIFADVSSSLLAQAGTAQVTVFTSGPGGGATSNAFPIVIYPAPTSPITSTLAVPVDSMLYDSSAQTLFASTSNTGAAGGNSLVEIDTSGTPFIARTTFVGNEPGPLAISDDASTLFVGPRRANVVLKYDIASHSLGSQIALGSDPFFGAYSPLYIAALPASTSTIAVARRDAGSAGVGIYDETTGKRTNETSRSLTGPLTFCSPSPYLFLLSGNVSRITVDAAGATLFDTTEKRVSGADFRCSNGRLYGGALSNPPTVVDPVTMGMIGVYAPGPFIGLSSIFTPFAVLPDANGLTYIVGDGNYEKVVFTYTRDTFVFLKKTSVLGIPYTARFTAVENLGGGRLAIATDEGKIYFLTIP